MDEFFTRPTPPPMAAPRPAPPAARRSTVRPLLVAAALGLALVAGLAVLLWPHPAKPSGPDPATARLFGQQTRTQLPAPVTRDECAAAVRAFPAIARSPEARAAFVEGCTHAE